MVGQTKASALTSEIFRGINFSCEKHTVPALFILSMRDVM